MRRIVLLFPLLIASAWAQCAGGAGVITSPSTCGGCSGGGGGGGSVSWGAIVGTLGNQLDLAAALNAKQNTIASYATISGLLGYPSAFNPVNTGDWAGTWQTHQPSYFQPALSAYSTISGLSGYPSTFPPINTGDWAGTWQGQSPGAWGRYFSATRTSGAVLTLGADCTSANPCPVRVGNTTYRLTSSATVTLSAGAGSGTAQVYVVSGGALTVGHNLTGADVTCGGCTAVSSVTNPPVPSTLLWTWTATSSTWDTSGGTDFRAAYSTQNVQAGSAGGVAVSTSGDATTVEQDPATIYGYAPARTGTIGSLPGTCGAGEQYFATDAPPGANLYFCTATDTWTSMGAIIDSFTTTSLTLYPLVNPTNTSYANPGGSGDRRSSIVVAVSSPNSPVGGDLTELVDGITSGGGVYFPIATDISGRWVSFDFGVPRLISEVTLYLWGSNDMQNWKWQASADSFAWTDISAIFDIPGNTSPLTVSCPGSTSYRYWRMIETSGVVSGGAVREVTFKISTDPLLDTTLTNYGKSLTYGIESAQAFQAIGVYKGTCDISARGQIYVDKGASGVSDQSYECIKDANDAYVWLPLTPSVRSDFFSWNVVPGTAWASAGAQTATLAPVPAGVNGADSSHNLYISDGSNSEVVTITGGTAVSGAASGTITFTTANAHNNTAWTLGSATAGIKEASEYLVSGGTIHVPAGNSTMRAAAAITKSAIKIVGDGGWSASYDDTSHGSVLVNHSNTADVIQIGDASNHTYGFQLESVGFTTDTYAVSGAATDGGLIKLTIAPHEFSTGDKVYVRNVGGVTAANGYWTATVVDGTHIDLQGSTFSGAYSSGGAVYRSKTAGSAIHLYSFSNASVRDVTIRHHYQPVLVGYGDNFHFDNYVIKGTTPNVISAGSAGIAINTAGNEVFVGKGVIDVDDGVWTANGGPCDLSYGFCPNQEPYAGILMLQGFGIYIDGASVIHGGHGLLATPTAGTAVTWVYIVNSLFDTSSGTNLIQPNGSGANVYGVVLANDWFTNNNDTGLTISQSSSGVVDGVQISNARVFDNRQNGIYLAAGRNLQIGSESQICGNGLGSSNTYDGLVVGAGASHWSFGNSTSGTCSGFGTNQRYGVNIGASGPYFRVVGNDLSGNATGGFANTSGAANGIVSNNLGYNPVGAGSISVTGSPFTYTAGPSPEVVYINGGTVSGVVRGSSTICAASPCQATLPPNGAVVVTYSSAPTMVKDVQ
jgi:hypothetical protein